MRQTEKALVKKILTYLNALDGCHAIKLHGGRYQSGQPDILACFEGRMIVIEVKVPGNTPTKLQAKNLELWSKAGALAFWVDSLESVRDRLRDLKLVV